MFTLKIGDRLEGRARLMCGSILAVGILSTVPPRSHLRENPDLLARGGEFFQAVSQG